MARVSVKAVLVGVVVDFVLSAILGLLAVFLWGFFAASRAASLDTLRSGSSTTLLIFMAVGFVSLGVGGFVVGKMAARAHALHGVLVGTPSLVFALCIGRLWSTDLVQGNDGGAEHSDSSFGRGARESKERNELRIPVRRQTRSVRPITAPNRADNLNCDCDAENFQMQLHLTSRLAHESLRSKPVPSNDAGGPLPKRTSARSAFAR